LPRPSAEDELLRAPLTVATLPALRSLVFRGVAAYLECLVARLRVPLLERLGVTLFNQLTFSLQHLSQLIKTAEKLRHPVANVIFNRRAVSFLVGPRDDDQHHDGTFSLDISCKGFDWQIDSAAQVCGALVPILSVAEELTLDFDEPPSLTSPDWQEEDTVDGIIVWHDLLRPFHSVKKLCVGHPLAWELSTALQSDDAGAGLIAGLLPELRELEAHVEDGHASAAFATFVEGRRLAGRPVFLSLSPIPIVMAPATEPPPPSAPDPDDYLPVVQQQTRAPRNWFRRAVVDRVRRRIVNDRSVIGSAS